MTNYLTTRQTRVGDCLSDEAILISGVVQGSGIGPVSFLIFVDELAKILERHGVVVKLFADDVKVYLPGVSQHVRRRCPSDSQQVRIMY